MESDDLVQNIRKFFLQQYNGSTDNPNTFLAFEPLGLMVSPDDFKHDGVFNPTLAQQQISIMADVVPVIDDTFEKDAMNKISDQYGSLTGDGNHLSGSMMFCSDNLNGDNTDEYVALFGNLKSTAQQKFSQSAEQASVLDPSSTVAQCNVYPSTWYDVNSPIWQAKSFQQTETQASTNQPPNRLKFTWKLNPSAVVMNNDVHIQHLLVNHAALFKMNTLNPGTVAPTRVSVQQPAGAARPIESPLLRTTVMAKNMSRAGTVSANTTASAGVVPPAEDMATTNQNPPLINKSNYRLLRNTLPFSQMVNLNRVVGLNTNVVSNPVNSSQFTISFSYSLVTIERDWLYQPLLDKAELWYALTMKAGEYSSGENSSANKGLLRCIPKAMIVVKDVAISASWSDADKKSADSAYGFGCFNISNSQPINSSTSNQLMAPGIQIIAWVCEVLPKLPLNDDPGMKDMSSNTGNTGSTTSTDTGNTDSTASPSINTDSGSNNNTGGDSNTPSTSNTPASSPGG